MFARKFERSNAWAGKSAGRRPGLKSPAPVRSVSPAVGRRRFCGSGYRQSARWSWCHRVGREDRQVVGVTTTRTAGKVAGSGPRSLQRTLAIITCPISLSGVFRPPGVARWAEYDTNTSFSVRISSSCWVKHLYRIDSASLFSLENSRRFRLARRQTTGEIPVSLL